jgi:hypothetical protein
MQLDDILGILVFVAVIGGLTVRGLAWNKVKAFGARSWPISQGRIESGRVVAQDARYFTYYVAQLAYSYSVSGEYYSGFYEKTFFREGSAQMFVDTLKGCRHLFATKRTPTMCLLCSARDQHSVWPLQV